METVSNVNFTIVLLNMLINHFVVLLWFERKNQGFMDDKMEDERFLLISNLSLKEVLWYEIGNKWLESNYVLLKILIDSERINHVKFTVRQKKCAWSTSKVKTWSSSLIKVSALSFNFFNDEHLISSFCSHFVLLCAIISIDISERCSYFFNGTKRCRCYWKKFSL